MTKRTIISISALAVVAIFIGGYVFLTQTQIGKDWVKSLKPGPSWDFSNWPESPRLTEFDSNKISRIENISEGYTLERKGNIWELVSANVPLDMVGIESSMISNKLWSMSSVWAEQLIEENPSDLSVYGLDKPWGNVRISDTDGMSAEFIFGNYTPSRTSFYLMMAGKPDVYTLSSYSTDILYFTLDSIRDKGALYSFDPNNIIRMILEKRPDENPSGKGPIEISVKKDDEVLVSAFTGHIMSSPYSGRYGVDSEKYYGLLESMQNIQILEYVADAPDSLVPFGLDKPGRIYLENPDDSLDILYGLGEYGVRYAMLAGDNSVFTIQGLDAFIGASPFNMMDKFAMIFNIDHVDSFTVTGDGRTLEATIQGKGDEAIFRLNGRRTGDKEFRQFYQAVIGLLIDAEVTGPVTRGEGTDWLVEYKLNTPAGVTASVRLIPFNRDFYVLERNGAMEFLIARTQARRIFETADRMVYLD